MYKKGGSSPSVNYFLDPSKLSATILQIVENYRRTLALDSATRVALTMESLINIYVDWNGNTYMLIYKYDFRTINGGLPQHI